jgi:O-antigen ligase
MTMQTQSISLRLEAIPLYALAVIAPWADLTGQVPIMFFLAITSCIFFSVKRKSTSYKPIFFLAAYLALIFLSFFWTQDRQIYKPIVIMYLFCFISFVSVMIFVMKKSDLRLFCYASLIGAVSAFLSLSVYSEDFGLLFDRYAIGEVNANYTAYVLAGGFFVTAVTIKVTRPVGVELLLMLAGMALIYYTITLLGTRGAQISVILTTLVLMSERLMNRNIAVLTAASLILIGISFSLGFLSPFLQWVDSFSERSTGDLSGRLLIWNEAIKFISQNLALGVGPGAFIKLNSFEVGAHNLFLTIMLDIGLIGLTVFVFFLYSIYSTMKKNGAIGAKLFLALLVYWMPMALSGHWETAPFSWAVVAFAINASAYQQSFLEARLARNAVVKPTETNNALAV